LAQESPEPVFDISECALKNVPAGIYSRCKVARKEALLLQENELTSITGGGNLSDLQDLHVLDLHKNCLEKLPEEIGQLKNLRVLYLQQNKLKSLPSNLGNLTKLTTLNLSENALKEVPVSLSSLSSLKTLDLRSNPKLKKIPKEIAALRCLETLLLDETAISYPDSSIVSQGTEAIMRFLCQESGLDYIPPSQAIPLQEQNGTNGSTSNGNGCPVRDPYEDLVKDHLDKAERLKEERRKQNLEMELSRQRDQEKEVELQKLSEMNKKKLLEDMAEEESRNDSKLVELQKQRESERRILNSRMVEAEQQSDEVISRLMQDGAKLSDPAKVMAALEADREAMEKQFTIVQVGHN
jgi:E3 ubiquitin-protein ligase LRSAM1